MRATWLHNNRRALLGALAPWLLLASLGGVLAAGWLGAAAAARIAGVVLLVVAVVPIGVLLWQLFVPRLACRDGYLLVYLRWTAPVRVPLSVVECFLLGQAPAGPGARSRRRRAQSVVVRLAEKATEWAHVEVQPLLGTWCGGQITVRGTWCEPLDVDLVLWLNRQLAEAQRQSREREVA